MNKQGSEAHTAALESQVEKARQEMRAFTYSVSHDLRAPLRAIEGFGRILQEDYSQALDEEGQRFLGHILNNAHTMSELIDDLLVFHRLGERTLSPGPVKMMELIVELAAAARPADRTVEIKIAPLPIVQGDAATIRAAWEQLISNAVKFSKRNPQAVIEFGSTAAEGEDVLWVRDNGIGFDMRYADKLFQVFQKLQRDGDFEGHGIGLAMVRRAVERHNGRVWVEAVPEQGATFFVALPRGK